MKGWRESSERSVKDILKANVGLPLAGVMHTNVNVEGKAAGIDLDEVKDFVKLCPHPVTASGGITTIDDLEALDKIGVKTAIVGLALYTNKIPPRAGLGEEVMVRAAKVDRSTKETKIDLSIMIDGSGFSRIAVDDQFLRHMLETLEDILRSICPLKQREIMNTIS